jgi:hypothetical protein
MKLILFNLLKKNDMGGAKKETRTCTKDEEMRIVAQNYIGFKKQDGLRLDVCFAIQSVWQKSSTNEWYR